MAIKRFAANTTIDRLALNSSASYTQVWETKFKTANRVVYMLSPEASCDVTFNVQIASDSSGTGATSITTNINATAASGLEAYLIDVTPDNLTSTKQYVSPLVTRSAGAYTLWEFKYDLRNPNNPTNQTNISEVFAD